MNLIKKTTCLLVSKFFVCARVLVLQPPRSHEPIRFAGNDVSMNLIGPCDLAD